MSTHILIDLYILNNKCVHKLYESAKCGYFTGHNKVIEVTLIPYLCTTIQRLSCTFTQSLQDTLGGPQPQFSEVTFITVHAKRYDATN